MGVITALAIAFDNCVATDISTHTDATDIVIDISIDITTVVANNVITQVPILTLNIYIYNICGFNPHRCQVST